MVAYNGVKNNVQIDYSPKRLDVQDTTVHTDVLTKSHSGYHFRLVPCLLELCAVVLKDIKASSTYPANGLCLKSNQSHLNFFVRKFGPLFFQECVQTFAFTSSKPLFTPYSFPVLARHTIYDQRSRKCSRRRILPC